jgi:long-chain acyl-CoA synthetase
LLSVWHF